MLKQCFSLACDKAGVTPSGLDYVFSGDLLNQCMGSAVALRDCGAPYFGLYGACSTMGESLSLAAMMLDGGYANTVCALTSSHFCSSERQYRFPLEYGGVRPPTSQWTVTGARLPRAGNFQITWSRWFHESFDPCLTSVTRTLSGAPRFSDQNAGSRMWLPCCRAWRCQSFSNCTSPSDGDLRVRR